MRSRTRTQRSQSALPPSRVTTNMPNALNNDNEIPVLGQDEVKWNKSVDGGPFRLPQLNASEKLFLIRRARESAVALVEHAHTLDGPMQWVDEGKHKGVQMYRGEGFAEDDHDVAPMEFLCGVTTMFGTIEEIAEYFDQETTLRMKAKKADDVLDCAVLYSLASASPTNPFQRVSVKYAAFEAPASLMRNRDYTYLECQDTFMHQSGRRGWVLSMHSIKLPTCPDVDGYVRGSMYHSGYVFIESSRPGYMDVMHSLQLNFKGKNRLPRFMLQAALKRRVLSVVRISREIQVTRMSQQTLLKKQELVPKNMRTLCVNCSRKFTLFIRKTRCRVCGEVVCQSCAPQMDWEAPDGSEIKKTRICLRCCNLALKQATHGSGAGGKQSEHTNLTPVPAPSNMHEYDEDMAIMDEPEDEGGMFTFDELEEQSSQSVFAPERFTRTTQVSICLSGAFNLEDMDADDYDYDDDASVRSSAYLWKTTKKGDPFYDVQQSYGGMTLPEDEEVAEVEEVIDDRQRRRAALAGLSFESSKASLFDRSHMKKGNEPTTSATSTVNTAADRDSADIETYETQHAQSKNPYTMNDFLLPGDQEKLRQVPRTIRSQSHGIQPATREIKSRMRNTAEGATIDASPSKRSHSRRHRYTDDDSKSRSKSRSRSKISDDDDTPSRSHSHRHHDEESKSSSVSRSNHRGPKDSSREHNRSRRRDHSSSRHRDHSEDPSRSTSTDHSRHHSRSKSRDPSRSRSTDHSRHHSSRSKSRDPSRDRSEDPSRSRSTDHSKHHSRSKSRDPSRSRSTDHSREPSRSRSTAHSRHHSRSKSRDRSRDRSEDPSRSRSTDHSRHHSRSKSRDPSRRRSRDHSREPSRSRSRDHSTDHSSDHARDHTRSKSRSKSRTRSSRRTTDDEDLPVSPTKRSQSRSHQHTDEDVTSSDNSRSVGKSRRNTSSEDEHPRSHSKHSHHHRHPEENIESRNLSRTKSMRKTNNDLDLPMTRIKRSQSHGNRHDGDGESVAQTRLRLNATTLEMHDRQYSNDYKSYKLSDTKEPGSLTALDVKLSNEYRSQKRSDVKEPVPVVAPEIKYSNESKNPKRSDVNDSDEHPEPGPLTALDRKLQDMHDDFEQDDFQHNDFKLQDDDEDDGREFSLVDMSIPRSSNPMSESSLFSFDDGFESSSLVERPTALIMEQVRQNRENRKNRSRTILLTPEDEYRTTDVQQDVVAEHQKRMAELNRIAVDCTGDRMSVLQQQPRPSQTPSQAQDRESVSVWRSSEMMRDKESEHERRMAALRQKFLQLQAEYRESIATASVTSESVGSHVGEAFADIDEDEDGLKEEDFEFIASIGEAIRSSDQAMARASQEQQVPPAKPPMPPLLPPPMPPPRRASPQPPESAKALTLDVHVIEDVQIPKVVTRKASIRDINDRRGSSQSQPQGETSFEAALSAATPQDEYAEADASPTLRVSTRTLYAQISELTKMQSEMAMIREKDIRASVQMQEEAEMKERIKEQYSKLRALKLKK